MAANLTINLSFGVACSPLAAWRALHSTRAAGQVYGPALQFSVHGAAGGTLVAGRTYIAQMRLLGRLPLGTQRIAVGDSIEPTGGEPIRTFHDSGSPLSGPLALLKHWDHRMTILPVAGRPQRCLWVERVEFAGALAPVLWPALALIWQMRRRRIQRLAPSWDAGQ